MTSKKLYIVLQNSCKIYQRDMWRCNNTKKFDSQKSDIFIARLSLLDYLAKLRDLRQILIIHHLLFYSVSVNCPKYCI